LQPRKTSKGGNGRVIGPDLDALMSPGTTILLVREWNEPCLRARPRRNFTSFMSAIGALAIQGSSACEPAIMKAGCLHGWLGSGRADSSG
jgi:hypothetical protein